MAKVSALLDEKGNDHVQSVTPGATVAEAAKILRSEKIGVVLCRDTEGGLVGILSERDLVRAVAEDSDAISSLVVRDLASRDVVTCKRSDNLKDIINIMGCGGFRHMPVVEEGRIIGLISATDILQHYMKHAPDDQAEVLMAYMDPFSTGNWA
jgi:CBS domain-containing protein